MDLLPYGALIGQVRLANIYPTDWLLQNLEADHGHHWQQEFAFDDYSLNRFAWQLEQPIPLAYNLPLKGTLGLWEYNGLFTLTHP